MKSFNDWVNNELIDGEPMNDKSLITSFRKHVSSDGFTDEQVVIILMVLGITGKKPKDEWLIEITNSSEWSCNMSELPTTVAYIRSRLSAIHPGKYSVTVSGGRCKVTSNQSAVEFIESLDFDSMEYPWTRSSVGLPGIRAIRSALPASMHAWVNVGKLYISNRPQFDLDGLALGESRMLPGTMLADQRLVTSAARKAGALFLSWSSAGGDLIVTPNPFDDLCVYGGIQPLPNNVPRKLKRKLRAKLLSVMPDATVSFGDGVVTVKRG